MKHFFVFVLLLFGVTFIGGLDVVKAVDVVDDFDQATLDPLWTWNAHPAINYSLQIERGFLTVNIPGDRSYDLWSNDVHDGMLLLRHDQGSGDLIIETRLTIRPQGGGFQTGLVIWSNPYVMYFWTIRCERGKKNFRLVGEALGISDHDYKGKDSLYYIDEEVVLRINKFGKSLQLQYWNDQTDSFETVKTYVFKFPVNGVGLMARTFTGEKCASLQMKYDYYKLIK